MSQRRIYDYDANVYSPDDNAVRQYLLPAGVYNGFALGIDTSADLTIAAGVGLQPDGVLWQEDGINTLAFTPPGVATNYTIVATHDDRPITSGVAVEYAIQSGLVATVTGGIVLGWIYHPGGGVPLAAAYLSDAPKMVSSEYSNLVVAAAPQRLYAPLPRTYSDVAAMGGNVTFSGQTAASVLFDTTYFVVHQRVAKAAGPPGAETLVQHIQFFMDDYRPTQFDLFVNIPGLATITAELRDTDLNIVTITGSPITTTTGWETKSIVVDRSSGTFDTGKPYELRLTHSVDVAQQIDLARVSMLSWPYPT